MTTAARTGVGVDVGGGGGEMEGMRHMLAERRVEEGQRMGREEWGL
jgi:hypothetical protein